LVALHSQFSFVPTFNGLNFSEWSEQIQFNLGIMDLDLSLREDKPSAITNISTEKHKVKHLVLFMGNRVKVPVEAVGTYRLILDTGHHLDLFETLYVPNISLTLFFFI
ncbi:hypothetical protein Lal_00031557, partial [Lupinus albus]